jgi:tRNA pseudouridine55 synthase
MSPSSPRPTNLHGILLVDKPPGITSAGVVREVKRRLGAQKIGHLGTLDPFASGLLPLALGEGAKVVPFLNQEEKSYVGAITLGRATDTLDGTGVTIETASVPEITAGMLEEVARRFHGDIDQVPPMFSALKRDGIPLYRLARKGMEVDRQPRKVRIEALSLEARAGGAVAISVRCSKGTYVRSLARDVARALGTVGHLSELRRTAFGRFTVDEAIALDAIAPDVEPRIVSPREALRDVGELEVGRSLAADLRRGEQRGLASLPGPQRAADLAKVLGPGGELVAIIGAVTAGWKLLRVFAPSASCSS